MFIQINERRYLNTQHIVEVNGNTQDFDEHPCTDIRMSNGDTVRLYPKNPEFKAFWTEWAIFSERQAAALEAGEVMQIQIKTSAERPDIDEALMKAIERILGDAASR